MLLRKVSLDGNISHWERSHGMCDILSTTAWRLQIYANVSEISNLLQPEAHLFWAGGCMTPILNRHMMYYITNSICVWQWRHPVPLRQLWVQTERGEVKGRSLPKCSFLAGLFGNSAPELTSWAQSFWHNGVKPRDCDVPLTQVNSIAPAGDMQTQTQTDCYQKPCVQLVFGTAVNLNDTFALHCFIKKDFQGDGIRNAVTIWNRSAMHFNAKKWYFRSVVCYFSKVLETSWKVKSSLLSHT